MLFCSGMCRSTHKIYSGIEHKPGKGDADQQQDQFVSFVF